ncbi:MAG: hypothetical protein JWL95_2882 [Gemmatimonadetes bacterium]|nr:hypothetical protein [Gemmatimonadota bacterium]
MKHMMINARLVAVLSLGVALSAGSSSAGGQAHASADKTSGAWRPLIDPTMSAWRGYKEAAMPAGWNVTDGVLSKVVSSNDIVTKDEFGNFELAFDWKLHAGGNAGVFYRGNEEFEKIYFTAPEYQLLDDAGHPDGKSRLTSAGADYALYPSPAGVVKPAEQWNSSRILVRGNHVEHWLNGKKVVAYELGSPDWEAKLKASKFATAPKYGRLARGHIGIQGDHAGALTIRDMRIRVLP